MGGGHVDAFEQAVRPGRRAGPNRHDEQVLPGVPRKLREFLGIDREHDVDFTREEPDYRHKSWNGQLLAEQRREESVGQRQEREESAEEERQTRLGR